MSPKWIGLLLLVGLCVPDAAAGVTAVSYHPPRSGDLFPDDPHVDVFVTVTGQVSWTLQNGTLVSGGSRDSALQPSAGPLTIQADYTIQPTCCPGEAAQGQHTFSVETPLACIAPFYTTAGWKLTIDLCGVLVAKPLGQGAATASPARLQWQTDWNPQVVHVASDAGAGGVLHVGAPTSYDFTVNAKIEGYGQTMQSASKDFKDNAGTPSLDGAYQILDAAGQTPEPRGAGIPGPLPLAAIAAAAFIARLKRKASVQ